MIGALDDPDLHRGCKKTYHRRFLRCWMGANIHPLVFLILINVLVLLLGCILDATVIILVIVPLFISDPVRRLVLIWFIFGVLIVVNSMIGADHAALWHPVVRHQRGSPASR